MVLGGVRGHDVGCYAFLGRLGTVNVVADQEDAVCGLAVDDRERRHRRSLNGRNVEGVVVRLSESVVKVKH